MKVLLSYPRSGNHLVRFFMELLTEKPTLGFLSNRCDLPIFENKFPEPVPFNIKSLDSFNKTDLYVKMHFKPKEDPAELIFILRNPREVLLRQSNYKMMIEGSMGFDSYFDSIEYYNRFEGKKCMFFYEDILTDKVGFVNSLCTFLKVTNEEKKSYVNQNVEKLFTLSKQGKGRAWGGVNSNSVSYYYPKMEEGEFKQMFDKYLRNKLETGKYNAIREKYNL